MTKQVDKWAKQVNANIHGQEGISMQDMLDMTFSIRDSYRMFP